MAQEKLPKILVGAVRNEVEALLSDALEGAGLAK
jgi:hypothetical protein